MINVTQRTSEGLRSIPVDADWFELDSNGNDQPPVLALRKGGHDGDVVALFSDWSYASKQQATKSDVE